MSEHNHERYFVSTLISVIAGFQLGCCGKGVFDNMLNKFGTDICPDRVKITEVRNSDVI